MYFTSLSFSLLTCEGGLRWPFLPTLGTSRALSAVTAQWPGIFALLAVGHVVKTHD